MKLGLLVPRYGEEVIGGTEHWLRSLAEHLVAGPGWEVEVFTTCAVSAATWADEYPAATTRLHGVTVHRHRSRSGRNPEYLPMLPRLRRDPSALRPAEVERYLELVGPVCPDAVEQAVGSGCDLVAATPYLYWPTVRAVPRLGRRVLFHGAAHDEPELYLPPMADVFTSVGGFAYNSFAERDLVESTFPVAHLPSSVIGNAVHDHSGGADPAAARAVFGLGPDEPFVLCVGRVERAKGSAALIELWDLYRARRPGAPRMVFVGPVHEPMPPSGHSVLAGAQPEAVKWGALAACQFLVVPSALESFSLVVLEAWLAGRPVLVNERCGATVEHCRRTGGGLWFNDYGEFEVAADLMLADPAGGAAMAERGATYARSAFGWDAVVGRYQELVARVLGR